jgi:hypothetical protein
MVDCGLSANSAQYYDLVVIGILFNVAHLREAFPLGARVQQGQDRAAERR